MTQGFTLYPFDWNVSNFSKISLLLFNNFSFFLDKKYLNPSKNFFHCLYNKLYDIDFAHDFPFKNGTIVSNWPLFLEEVSIKYQRRIERFRKLSQHKGLILFLHINQYNRSHYTIKNIQEVMEALRLFLPLSTFKLVLFDMHKPFKEKNIFSDVEIIPFTDDLNLKFTNYMQLNGIFQKKPLDL